jgi:hypothetical protein
METRRRYLIHPDLFRSGLGGVCLARNHFNSFARAFERADNFGRLSDRDFMLKRFLEPRVYAR